MTIILDTYESNTTLTSLCDEQRELKVEGTDNSYDLHVEADDGTEFRIERKTFSDAVSSFQEGRLDQQASRVDVLVVEEVPDWDSDVHDEDSNWLLHVEQEFQKRVLKHLWHLLLSMPVAMPGSAYETIVFCRYLESKGKDAFEVRANDVRFEAEDIKTAIIGQFKNVNPHRSTEDGVLMDHIDAIVDWDAVADAILYPDGEDESPWLSLARIGEKTIQGIEEDLRDAR